MPDKQKDITLIQPSALTVPEDPGIAVAVALVRATVQARHLMARANPRSVDQARDSILRACRRTGFAEKVEFSKPIGGKPVRGPSVRFAELALKEWGNVDTKSRIIYEDDLKRITMIEVSDIQTNVTYTREIVVHKTVERKKYSEDRELIGERTNVKGEKVYILRATEDEMQNKENALISKAVRNEGLRLIPTDITEEAVEIARETLKQRDESDPDAAKKQIMDAFSAIGIRPSDIITFLGHSLDQLVPAEIQNLRAMYRAIKDGEATWRDYLEKEEKVEVDESQVVKFDMIATERKADPQILQVYLKEIADNMKITIDELKMSLLGDLPNFWQKFDARVAKEKGGKK